MITSLLRKSKANHFKIYFQENKENLKKTWDGIKSVINSNKNKTNIPQCMNINNKNVEDPIMITNACNEYFGTTLSDQISSD